MPTNDPSPFASRCIYSGIVLIGPYLGRHARVGSVGRRTVMDAMRTDVRHAGGLEHPAPAATQRLHRGRLACLGLGTARVAAPANLGQPVLRLDAGRSTVSSPYSPSEGLRGWPEFVRYWSMNTRRPVGVILYRKPGTMVSRSSTSLAWGCAASTAVLVSLIFAMMTPRNDPDSKSPIGAGAAREETESGFRKHRHMIDARRLLINR